MSSIADKADQIFWEQNGHDKKIVNNLTPLQAINILNLLSLKHKFDDEDLKELEEVKIFIKNRKII